LVISLKQRNLDLTAKRFYLILRSGYSTINNSSIDPPLTSGNPGCEKEECWFISHGIEGEERT